MNGKLIKLGPLTPEDFPLIDVGLADLETSGHLGYLGSVAAPGDAARAWEQKRDDPNARHFAIRTHAGLFPGRCSIFGINHRHQHAEFGIVITDKAQWGKGYGTEATQLIVDYGLYYLGLRNLFLWAYGYNMRAMRTYEKAGFWEVGRLRNWIWFGEQWWDGVLMQCDRESIGPSRVGLSLI